MDIKESTDSGENVKRFSPYRIVEHLALIILFVILAVTGLSQKFNSVGAAQSIIVLIGGIDNVRLFHHVSGVIFAILTAQHVFVNFYGIIFRQWEPSMLVAVKDTHEALQNVKYYLGLADQPAMCGRYNYKEKFVYWLILSGGVQMIVTGFFLRFPVAATRYFPGQFIPASKVVHSNEGMLIFLLVAIWHIYDSVLSPNVFPLNKSIFTGYDKRKPARQ